MATHRWNATAASGWVAASFDSNSLPASNDTVVFGAWAQGDVVSGLDQTAIDLDLLSIQSGYHGRIGNNGNPLIISADLTVMRGQGSLYYQNGAGTTDLMIIDSDNLVDAATIGGTPFTRLRLLKGRTKLVSGIETLASLEVSYRNNLDGDVILDALGLPTNRPIITDYRQDGGTALLHRPLIETMIVSGGLLRIFDFDSLAAPAFTLQTGGRLAWTAASSAGAFTWPTAAYHLLGGVLDLSEGAAKTITSLSIYSGGQLYDPNGNLTAASTLIQMSP